MTEPSYSSRGRRLTGRGRSPRPEAGLGSGGLGSGGLSSGRLGSGGLRSSGLLASGLLSLATGGLLLALFGAWTSLQFAIPAAVTGRALLLFAVLALLVLLALPRHLPLERFGPANGITLLRALAACWLAATLGVELPAAAQWLLAGVALLALLLDGLDGWAARRGGWASRFGARFDMECDAFFLATLSALAVDLGRLGPWVLAAGALRYLFLLAGRLRPWLRRPLADSRRRKAAYAVTAGVLVAVLFPAVPPALATPAGALAVALLAASFLADVRALARQDATPPRETGDRR